MRLCVLYNIAADIVVFVHFTFIVFVLVGGVLVFKWRRLIWLHIPSAIWGAMIVMVGWICPLTPIENRLRHAGESETYTRSFIEHYLVPVIYPSGLDREMFIVMGMVVIVINVIVYIMLFVKYKREVKKNKLRP